MKLNWKYTVGWILWALGFVALEFFALKDKRKGDTLSEHVQAAIGTGSKKRTVAMWTFRLGLGGLFVWLIPHFFTAGW